MSSSFFNLLPPTSDRAEINGAAALVQPKITLIVVGPELQYLFCSHGETHKCNNSAFSEAPGPVRIGLKD